MSCKFIDNIETGKKERSASYDRTYNMIGNTDLAVRIHKQFQTPFFKNFFGDWVKARNEYREGKYKTPEEAFMGNEVSLMVNDQFEPLIVFYSSERSDFTPANLQYLGTLSLNEYPVPGLYNYPVAVRMLKQTNSSDKQEPMEKEVLVDQTMDGTKYIVNGGDVMSIFPSGSQEITVEQQLEKSYPENGYTEKAFEQRLLRLNLVNTRPKKDEQGFYEVKRSKQDFKYDTQFKDGRHFVTTLEKNVATIQSLNNYYKERVGVEPYEIVQRTDKTYMVRVVDNPISFDRNYQNEYAPANIEEILIGLRDKTGVQYEIITAEQALEMLGGKYNGEPGFYYQSKVYMVKDKLNPSTALHEYAHPFVLALRKQNPELYGNILNSIISSNDPFVQNTIDFVQDNYSEYSEEEKTDEVIVRVMTGYATGQVIQKSKIKSIIDKILFFIRQQLRRIFNDNTVDLSKLSSTTTIEELSNMLYTGQNNIKLAKDYSVTVSPLFNKEMADKIDAAIENSTLVRKIQLSREFMRRAVRMLENNKLYAQLVEELKSERSAGTILESNLLQLSNLEEFEKDVTKNFNMALGLARTLVTLDVMTERLVKHTDQILADNNMSPIEKGRSLIYYKWFMENWKEYMNDFKREFRKIPEVGSRIASIEKNIKDFDENVYSVIDDAALDFYTKELEDLQKKAVDYFGGEIERLEKIYRDGEGRLEPGSKITLKKIEKNKEYLERFNYTRENIRKYIRGEYGDTNIFSYLFEAYASSPNPLVQSFAHFINKQFYIIEDELQRENRKLADNFTKIYNDHNLQLSATEIGERITFVDYVTKRDKDGNIEKFAVRTFLNPFGNGWRYWYDKLRSERDEAAKEDDADKIVEARKRYRDFVTTFMHDVYKPEVYVLKEYWNKNEITKKAYAERRKITLELSQLNNSISDWTDSEITEMERLVRKLHYLASEFDEVGNPKSDEDIEIARAIKDYYQISRQYYEPVEVKGLFDSSRVKYEDYLLALGFNSNDREYKEKMDAWFKKNMRITLSDTFYQKREAIGDAIDAIMSKYPEIIGKNSKVGETWKTIIDLVRNNRDVHGQPIGNQMTEEKIQKIKDLLDEIDKTKKAFYEAERLDNSEKEELSYLMDLEMYSSLDDAQRKRLDELIIKSGKMLKGDKATLLGLFNQIRVLQSRIPSEYYIDTINEQLSRHGIDFKVTYDNYKMLENIMFVSELAKQGNGEEFLKWFEKNHRVAERWNEEGKGMEIYYERVYVWNRIVPNDKQFISDLQNGQYQKIFETKYEDIEVRKANWYYDYKIKKEHVTERIVGETIDSTGRWLPRKDAINNKMVLDGQELNFRNEEYFRLQNSSDTTDQGVYKILEEYKKFHLGFQERNMLKHHNLYLDVPRVRKQSFEVLGDAIKDPGHNIRTLLQNFKDIYIPVKREDDFDRGILSSGDVKRVVMTDFAGNEIMSIPVKHTSMIEADQVSLDIGHSVVKYASSLATASRMYEINPINQILLEVAKTNSPIDVTKESFVNKVISGMNVGVRSKNNRVYDAMKNVVERHVYGIENHMEIGLPLHKVSQTLMKLAAWGSLSLNLPRGFVNHVVGMNQNIIESISGLNFTPMELAEAEGQFITDFIKPLVESYNKTGGRTVESQLMEIFDPIMGRFQEMAGTEYANRYFRDLASGKITMSPQKLGEVMTQGTMMVAMLKHQKIDYTDPKTGKKEKRSYLEAWEVRDGVIDLKPGYDPSYGRGGDNFYKFKSKIHMINTRLQGAYDPRVQSEIERYTLGKLASFMRRYVVPGMVSRYSPMRPWIGESTFREGYILNGLKTTLDLLKTGGKSYHLLNEQEKKNLAKSFAEYMFSLAYYLTLVFVLGFDPDDPDKYKKMRKMSYLEKIAIFELLMIKSETETFILPSGLNEMMRLKNTPSVAFPMMDRYLKFGYHLYELLKDPLVEENLSRYERKTGFFEKGDYKIMNDIMNISGAKSYFWLADPVTATKNYMNTINRNN